VPYLTILSWDLSIKWRDGLCAFVVSVLLSTTACGVGTRVCCVDTSSRLQIDDESKGSQQEVGKRSEVHQVRWKTATGDIVFDALNGDGPSRLAKGLTWSHNGRADDQLPRSGTCGTCAVQIDGDVQPAECTGTAATILSTARIFLDVVHTSSGLPSAGQATFKLQGQVSGGNMMIWQKGLYRRSPFGELEFLLDDKSPDDFRRHHD
jgi:hypothetical protein